MIVVLDCNIWISLTINRRLDYVAKVAELHDLVSKTYKLTNIPQIVSDGKDNYLFASVQNQMQTISYRGDKIVLQVGVHEDTTMVTLSELEAITNHM